MSSLGAPYEVLTQEMLQVKQTRQKERNYVGSRRVLKGLRTCDLVTAEIRPSIHPPTHARTHPPTDPSRDKPEAREDATHTGSTITIIRSWKSDAGVGVGVVFVLP